MHNSISLNPNCTFNNFSVTDNNCFACKAALEVAEGKWSNYFPLYIFGRNGIGKTHLLHAIGNHSLMLNESLRVAYLSPADFYAEFIKQIKSNHHALFTDNFRDVDILLLDDVHEFAGKEVAQEQLFHIHDLLLYSGKMLVVAADKPPMQIPQLENRIVTCFIGGVIAEIQ